MTPEELTRICEYFYGRNWQTELAKKLEVNPRTVRRWKSGATKIPWYVDRFVRLYCSV